MIRRIDPRRWRPSLLHALAALPLAALPLAAFPLAAQQAGFDRTRPPALEATPALTVPAVRTVRLMNGPSLNVVEHPIYDVWTKACAMKHPEAGPDTLVARGDASASNNRSSAKKSAGPEEETPAAAPAPATPATADTNAAR